MRDFRAEAQVGQGDDRTQFDWWELPNRDQGNRTCAEHPPLQVTGPSSAGRGEKGELFGQMEQLIN